MIEKPDFTKDGLTDFQIIVLKKLIDEVNRLSELTKQLVEQDRRQIELWEGLRDILKK
jgi:hypothetical protein